MRDDADRRDLDATALTERLRAERRAVSDEGRPKAVERQHEHDKLTARERVRYLCDRERFDEIGQLAAPAPATPERVGWEREDAPADGVVAGIGEVDGRPVAVAATDFTVKGGSIGHTGGRKLERLYDLAIDRGYPVVTLHDGGGHRIQEGLDARPTAQGDGGLFRQQTKLSGWVPFVSAMMGPGFAAPTNFSVMADFVPMVEGSTLGVAGPSLVEAALGTELSKQELGGTDVHTARTGMADAAYPSDEACLDAIIEWLSYLPRNCRRDPPASTTPASTSCTSYPFFGSAGMTSTSRSGSRSGGRGRRRLRPRTEAPLRPERRHRPRPRRGQPRRCHRERADRAGRHHRHRRLGEGRPLRLAL